MNSQGERSNATTPSNCQSSTLGYLVAGLGVGAALSLFLAPKSGVETRKWIADKCLNAIDTANQKVQQSRVHVRDVLDRRQQQISEAVTAGREAIGKPKAAAN
jgi:gas vesicle protein